MKQIVGFLAVVLVAALVACAGPPAPGAQSEQTAEVQATRTPLIQVPAGAEELIQAARSAVAERLEQVDNTIDIIGIEPAEWPTAAMGCPGPDQMYAEVVTPGYVIRLRTGSGVYEVHVSRTGQVVICDAGEEAGAMNVPADAELAVLAARRDLASRTGVSVDDVRIMEFQAVDWRDSSLGCPEPGRMYLQVITPGYRVVLQAAGQSYEYHTNRGNRAVLCSPVSAGTASQKLRLQELRDVAETARNDLAERLGIEPAGIMVVELVSLDRLDEPASCPEANQLPAVGTEYQIELQAAGVSYIYRTRGQAVVLCAQ